MPTQHHCMRILLMLCLSLSLAPHAYAGDICWIDEIKFTPTEVNVRFTQSVQGMITKGSQRSSKVQDIAQWIAYSNGTVVRSYGEEQVSVAEPPREGGVTLPNERWFMFTGSAHDYCDFHLTTRDGKRGLYVQAKSFMPGRPADTVEKFILAP